VKALSKTDFSASIFEETVIYIGEAEAQEEKDARAEALYKLLKASGTEQEFADKIKELKQQSVEGD